MGKKKIIQKTEEELLQEKEKMEKALTKATGGAMKKAATDIGRVYINVSFNNTIITVTNKIGDVIAWTSAGSLGFSGPKKATPFAASKVVAAIAEKVKKIGIANVDIVVKGVGSGRDSAIRSLANQGFNILSIRDLTPIPHNGPRPPKVRRV